MKWLKEKIKYRPSVPPGAPMPTWEDKENKMLRLKSQLCDGCQIHIEDPGVGEWKLINVGRPSYTEILDGFGGELQITIVRDYMQSGNVDIVMVFCPMDGYCIVKQQTCKTMEETENLNRMLREFEEQEGYNSL